MSKIVNFLKKYYSSIVFLLVLTSLLILRLPSWMDSYKLQGNQLKSSNVYDLNHNVVKLPDELKKPSVIFYWATWCGVCKLELSRINESIKSGDFEASHIYAISLGEDFDRVKAEATSRGYEFNVLVDVQNLMGQQYNIKALPTVMLIDSNNTITWTSTGISPSINFRVRSHLKSPGTESAQ